MYSSFRVHRVHHIELIDYMLDLFGKAKEAKAQSSAAEDRLGQLQLEFRDIVAAFVRRDDIDALGETDLAFLSQRMHLYLG